MLHRLLSCVCVLSAISTGLARAADAPAASDDADRKAATAFQDDWLKAAKAHDAAALDRLLADDYVQTGPTGQNTGKQEFVQLLKDGTLAVESGTYRDVVARVYGSTAVVTGIVSVKATAAGNDVGGDYRFTQVLVKHDGKYQAVAMQFTTVRE